MQTKLTTPACSLLRKLLEHLPIAPLCSETIPQYLVDWIISTESQAHNRTSNSVRAVQDLLRFLPEDIAAEQVVKTAEKVVSTCLEKGLGTSEKLGVWQNVVFDSLPETLFDWPHWATLQQERRRPPAEEQSTASIDDSESDVEKEAMPASQMQDYVKKSLNTPRRILVRLWTIKVLSSKELFPAGSFNPRTDTPRSRAVSALIQQLEVYASSVCQDALSAFILAVQDLPLPPIGLLESVVPYLQPSRLPTFYKSLTLLEERTINLKGAFRRGHWYSLAQEHFLEVIASTSSEQDIFTEQFAEICRHVIHDSRIPHIHMTVVRMLRHHGPLRAGLSRAWMEGTALSEMAALRGPSPRQVYDLIHALAFAYAHSPVLNRRIAFRGVHWCWRLLKDHGAELKPEMTRALYHAGVVRYRRWGVSARQVDYVMEKVRQLDGDEVADILLGYR